MSGRPCRRADVEWYTKWMKDMLVPLPEGHYKLKSFAEDVENGNVIAAAVLQGTHTVDADKGGPTGESIAADYVNVMNFKDGKIRHMTKIGKDGDSLRQLGGA